MPYNTQNGVPKNAPQNGVPKNARSQRLIGPKECPVPEVPWFRVPGVDRPLMLQCGPQNGTQPAHPAESWGLMGVSPHQRGEAPSAAPTM